MIQTAALKRPFSAGGGHAFIANIPAAMMLAVRDRAMVVVTENGRMLGPAAARHQRIREEGGGAFSVWHEQVYLSASDNSDPNANGREYGLLSFDLRSPSLRDELASDDAFVLDLLARNRQLNNSVVSNFLGYYRFVSGHLAAFGIEAPKRVAELGSGRTPYAAMRFMAEGVEQYLANDVMRVDGTFGATFVKQLAEFMDDVDAGTANRLRAKVVPEPGGERVRIRGLETAGERPFETLTEPRELDLVFSSSVLEHVDQPRAVVERMFDLLRPGGHIWHSIDLRDHTDFDKPLEFLRMTAADYARINTENRLRASDWRELLLAVGFEILDTRYSTILIKFLK